MKKILKFLPALLIAVACVSLWSCSSDDDDEIISANSLPENAKTFLATYYPAVNIVSVTKDKNDYEVYLVNGHEVEFDREGEWIDVDAPVGETVPSGFYPAAIDSYLIEMNFGAGINEISRTISGYDVELVNGSELIFSSDGTFVGYDRD